MASAVTSTIVYVVTLTMVGAALPHMQGAFSATRDRISRVITAVIIGHTSDDRSWYDYKRGKPIPAQQVARLLKPFGVASGSIRLGGGTTPKGHRSDVVGGSRKQHRNVRLWL